MAEGLRMLAALPSTPLQAAYNHSYSSFRVVIPVSGFLGCLHSHAHIPTQIDTYMELKQSTS